MAGRVHLVFLLAIVALVCADDALKVEQNIGTQIKYVGKLDKAFDALLPDIRNVILKNGMDPMQLVDVSDPLLPDLPGVFKGKIELKKGWLQELSKLKRADHVIVTYEDKKLTFDLDLAFDVLDFNYEYFVQFLFLKRQGDVNGRFYNLKLKVIATIDLVNYKASLQSIKFADVGKYDIKFEGHLLDPIVNAATKVVTVVFKKPVLKLIEDRGFKIFTKQLDEFNKRFRPSRPQQLEEWFYARMLNVQYY